MSVFWVAYVFLWTAVGLLFYPARLAPFAAGMVGICLHVYSLLTRMFRTMHAAEQSIVRQFRDFEAQTKSFLQSSYEAAYESFQGSFGASQPNQPWYEFPGYMVAFLCVMVNSDAVKKAAKDIPYELENLKAAVETMRNELPRLPAPPLALKALSEGFKTQLELVIGRCFRDEALNFLLKIKQEADGIKREFVKGIENFSKDIEQKLEDGAKQLGGMGETGCQNACEDLKVIKTLVGNKDVQSEGVKTARSMVAASAPQLLAKANDELENYFPPEMLKMLEGGAGLLMAAGGVHAVTSVHFKNAQCVQWARDLLRSFQRSGTRAYVRTRTCARARARAHARTHEHAVA